jgi:opacity protein-like surface antigen
MRMNRDVLPRAAALLALLALLALASALSPARAEERKNTWEGGFFLGDTFYAKEQQLSNENHYGVRLGWNFKPAYELEFEYLRTQSSTPQEPSSTLLSGSPAFFGNPDLKFTSVSFSTRLLINPRNERRRFKPYAIVGLGGINYTSNPKLDAADQGYHDSFTFLVGGGVRQRLTGHMALRGELETEYSASEIFHNEHLNVGLTWTFGAGPPADSDGDGVIDLIDRCPDTPKGATVDPPNGKNPGCPWDLDGDGVMEGIDKCPNTPRGWPVDEKGCPTDTDGDGVPDGGDKCPDTPKGAVVRPDGCPIDSDGDGIFDGIDKCPNTPKGATVDPPDGPNPGCPHDTDKDGVPDGIDACALTPEGAIVDEKGCPTDSDGDKVLDGIDKCPDTPKGQKIDHEGCPRVRLDNPEPQVLQNVKFLQGVELYPGTEAWIGLAVDALEYWSDVTIELGVYTAKGESKNLAQRRAEVLKSWLVKHGIDVKRIVAKGYGPVDFVAGNDTEEEKEKNRRVELKKLSGDLRKHPKPQPEAPAEPEPGATPSGAPAAGAPKPAEEAKPAPPAPPAAEPAPSPAPSPSATPAPAPAPTPSPAPPPAPAPTPAPAPGATPAPEATPTPAPEPSPGP